MLKTGARLRSQVCTTEVIVVRGGSDDLTLCCGGHPMLELSAKPTQNPGVAEDFADGTQIGKRYVDEAGTVEILATKSGAGSLSIGDTRLSVRGAKSLPSSD